jgi:hypothetical protein
MTRQPTLTLGAWRPLDGSSGGRSLKLPPNHLVTHSVVLGMTGSGFPSLDPATFVPWLELHPENPAPEAVYAQAVDRQDGGRGSDRLARPLGSRTARGRPQSA